MRPDPDPSWDAGLLSLEPGTSGSLHMTLSADAVRETLAQQPMPAELLEPLWDSASGAAAPSTSLSNGASVCAVKRLAHVTTSSRTA